MKILLWGKRTAFTCSAITPPKVNRFGWNLEQCEPNVGGWPWQILGAIHAVLTVERKPKFFCPVNNTWFRKNFTTFQHNNVDRWGSKNCQNRNLNILTQGVVFPKITQKLLANFPSLATSGRHNSAMITDRRKFTSTWSLHEMSSLHFYH